MSDILEKIRAAKVTAAENVVIEDLREKGLIPKEPGIMAGEPHIIGGALIKQYDRMIQLTGKMLLCRLPNDPDDLEDLIKIWARELRQIANEILKEYRR